MEDNKGCEDNLFKFLKEEGDQIGDCISEVLKVDHRKLITKNILSSKSYNIHLLSKESGDFGRNYDQVQSFIKRRVGKKARNFNISNLNLSVGDNLPMKFLKNEKTYEIIRLPRNKINLLFFRNKPTLISDTSNFNILEYIMTKAYSYISCVLVSSSNSIDESLSNDKQEISYSIQTTTYNSFSQEFIKLNKLFNFDFKEDYNFIIYNKDYQVLSKGSFPTNNISYNDAEKLFLQTDVKIKPTEMRKKNNLLLNNLSITNENLITNKESLNEMKKEIKKIFNKKYLKSKCESIANAVININTLTKYEFSENKKKSAFKSHLEFNHVATMKNRTGQILDEFLIKFKENIFTNKTKNEELKRYVKYSCDYERNMFKKILGGNFENMKFTLKKTELLGLTNYKIKYRICNKFPLNNYIPLTVYLSNLWAEYQNYHLNSTVPDILRGKVEIKLNWDNFLKENPGYGFFLHYFNEKKEQMVFTPVEGTLHLIFLLKTHESYIFEEYMPIFPVIENFKRVHQNVKIEVNIGILAEEQDIGFLQNFEEFKNFLKFGKVENSQVMYIPRSSLFADWMKYTSHLEHIAITPEKRVVPFGSQATNDFSFFLKKTLYPPKEYSLTINQYKDLKSYAHKLMRIKINGLNYQPVFCLEFIKNAELDLSEEKSSGKTTSYDKSKYEYSVKLFVEILRKDKHVLTPFINKVKQILNVEDLVYFENLSEVVDIPLGKVCNNCGSTELGLNIPHFYCYHCNVHFCLKCGNNYKSSELSTYQDLPHEHYLTYINVNNESGLKNMETFKFGNNIFHQFNFGQKASVYSTYLCGVCYEENYNAARYICISCRPGPYRGLAHFSNNGYMDICPECFINLQEKKITDEKFLRELEIENHDQDSHVYLRVEFCTGEYSSI